MYFVQPFTSPIPSEPWTIYVLNADLASAPTSNDYLALVQNGAIRRLPYSTAKDAVIVAVQSGATYQVATLADVIAINKTIPSLTTITLEASPADGRRLEIADWAGNANGFPVTINGNGKLIRGTALYYLTVPYQAAILTYSEALGAWNVS